MKAMMKALLIGAPLFFSYNLNAQVIWTEDFSAGSAARGTLASGYPGSSGGTWSQTNNVGGGGEGAAANQWYVSGEECGNAPTFCGSGCSGGDASLHVSAIGGFCGTPDCGAAYDATNATNITDKRIESPNINTTGFGGLTIDFNYIAAQGDDGVTVVYSCNGGTTWTTLGALTGDNCCCIFPGFCGGPDPISCTHPLSGQGYWVNQSYALPVCAENIANFKIGFHWVNDGDGIGTDPSFAVDDMTLTATTTLPVEFSYFTGIAQASEHHLTWETITELNSSHFEIQRSANGKDFETIGSVRGMGTTQTVHTYNWIDKNPMEGDNFYRLRQVDFDGQYAFTRTILLEKKTAGMELTVYPNPAEHVLNVQHLSILPGPAKIFITDLSGRLIQTEAIVLREGINQFDLDVSELKSGNYFVSIESSEELQSAMFRK